MKQQNGVLITIAGILSIGLLIVGLLSAQDLFPSSLMKQQDGLTDPDFFAAPSISKEMLLLLLAVGIAGVLGMSRRKKKKGVNTGANASESNRSCNLQNASVDKRKQSATDSL